VLAGRKAVAVKDRNANAPMCSCIPTQLPISLETVRQLVDQQIPRVAGTAYQAGSFTGDGYCALSPWRRVCSRAFEQSMGATRYYVESNPAMSLMGQRTLQRIVADSGRSSSKVRP
jgi:hypothetical protein